MKKICIWRKFFDSIKSKLFLSSNNFFEFLPIYFLRCCTTFYARCKKINKTIFCLLIFVIVALRDRHKNLTIKAFSEKALFKSFNEEEQCAIVSRIFTQFSTNILLANISQTDRTANGWSFRCKCKFELWQSANENVLAHAHSFMSFQRISLCKCLLFAKSLNSFAAQLFSLVLLFYQQNVKYVNVF